MAIRNTNMGGSDWIDHEVLKAVDLNDTFDEAYNLALQNPCFFLNSELYDVYDDFDSYSAGTLSSNSKWTNTTSGNANPSIEVSSSTNAGGSTKELLIEVNDNTTSATDATTATAEMIALAANRHTWFRIFASAHANNLGSDSSISPDVTFDGGSTWHDIATLGGYQDDGSMTCRNSILVIALGSNQYDCYIGGIVVQTVTDSSFTIKLRTYVPSNSTQGSSSKIYIDDVRQSKVNVS